LGRDTWLRGVKETIEVDEDEDDIEVEDNPLFSLIKAYRYVVKTSKKAKHKVFKELKSISDRVVELKTYMMVGKRVLFEALIDRKNLKGDSLRDQILITFLSLLELGKLGFVRVYQAAPFEDIHVDTLKPLDENFIDKTDGYSYVTGEMSAEDLFSKNQDILEEKDEEIDLSSDQAEFDFEDSEEGVKVEGIEDLPLKEEDIPFIIEAASDDDIIEEEKRLNIIESEPLIENEITTDIQLDKTEELEDGEL
ncbi:hypothetical protein N9W41_01700, partial [bacterium]|nr:hypothetical protein [bacterium]